MPTGTGDPTADLLGVLKVACPEVAEETLARLAAATVALSTGSTGADPAAGGGPTEPVPGAPLGPRWTPLTLAGIPRINEFITVVQTPVEVIAAVLEFVAGILDVVSALLIGIPDPFSALIQAAVRILTEIVEELLGSGAYLFFDAPGLTSAVARVNELRRDDVELPRWVAGDRPPTPDRPADAFDSWAYRFRQSFDDPGDLERPVFSDGAPIEALFIVATAPQLADLASLGPLLTGLFDMRAFGAAWKDFASSFPVLPADPDRSRLAAMPVHPDWHSWTLRDVGGPLGYPVRYLEKVPELLAALLLNVDSVVDLIRALVDAVRSKVELLQDIVAVLQQIIDALAALTASGLHGLFVVTDQGVDGLVEAFLGATDRPGGGAPPGSVAMAGICLLAGTSEILPTAAAPIWALLGHAGSADRAYAGLKAEWAGLKEQAEAAAADTDALATDTWTGLENGGSAPVDQGIVGMWGGLRERYDAQRDEVLDALGLTEAEADEQARVGRTALVPALEQVHAEGVPLDPVVLAHLEAARRARRRGRRSLGMSLGTRVPADPGDRP